MQSPEAVIRRLRARGEIWEVAPGLVGLRGDAARLRAALLRAIRAIAAQLTDDEWRVPPGLPLAVLARADYFASFPQWLTAVGHLGADEAVLERVAGAAEPAEAARAAMRLSDIALPPAVCYHVYAQLAGRRLEAPVRVAAECICWRHEAPRLEPLARDWAFTMQEAVCVADAADADAFRLEGTAAATALAGRLGLRTRVVQAEDPFFQPTARGRALLQRLKALKHELVIDPPGQPPLAIASFNHHERFFGDAFAIEQIDGRPAASACVAFGIERWLLALLVTHGPEPADWPIAELSLERNLAPDADARVAETSAYGR